MARHAERSEASGRVQIKRCLLTASFFAATQNGGLDDD
jgi:hypothetical protein